MACLQIFLQILYKRLEEKRAQMELVDAFVEISSVNTLLRKKSVQIFSFEMV